MEEGQYQQDYYSEIYSKVRDMEEKDRLLRERVLLLGETLVQERDKTFKDMQEMKKALMLAKEENTKIKEMLARIIEQLDKLARKEELMILQRQFDLFRKE